MKTIHDWVNEVTGWLVIIVGILILMFFVWKYAPEPTRKVADAKAQQRVLAIETRYETGCGVLIDTPVIMVDNLHGKVDVTNTEDWSITIDAVRWEHAQDNVLNDTIPHGVAHLVRHQQLGHSSMIHDAEFLVLEAYLKNDISSCPKVK